MKYTEARAKGVYFLAMYGIMVFPLTLLLP